jgi:hypothetical protein
MIPHDLTLYPGEVRKTVTPPLEGQLGVEPLQVPQGPGDTLHAMAYSCTGRYQGAAPGGQP